MNSMKVEDLPGFRDLVSGFCQDVPQQESNTVRVFISSTFTDMIHERNKLTREVYPKLQRYCQEMGLDFEAVDMRWGVHDNVTTDHKTTELCMLEIDHCKELSQGPCFVAFLGNKYGYRPLCATIEADVFEELCGMMDDKVDPAQIALLKDWYRRDDNAVPPVYVLLPITSKLPHFDDNSAYQASAREEWSRVCLSMRTLLADTARKAVDGGIFQYERMKNFFISVTEQEVLQAFHGNRDPGSSIIVFMREFDGIRGSDPTPKKRVFIDCDENGEEDHEAQGLLKTLKEDFIPSNLPPSSIHKFTVPWDENGLHPDALEHAAYLDNFTEQFHDSVKALIDRKLSERSKVVSPELKSFYEELIHHYSFQQEKCRYFKGGKEILAAIQRVLVDRSNRPCILHGISGSGKTSVMAMFAKNAASLYPGRDPVCVLRFLGTSPLSTSIRDTILSVCQQICYAYNLDQPESGEVEDFSKLDMFFKSLLMRAPTVNRPLLLLLDSVDQLSPANNAFSMNWLPLTFSEHAHVVVSMLPKVNNCLSNMRRHISNKECYVQMTPVEQNLGLEIIDSWLEQLGRRITDVQRDIIASAIANCPQPLFLKILFEEVCGWRSYKVMTEKGMRLPHTVRAAITRFFEELERNHGPLLVSHTLGFLTAGRQGITELELRDVLSCDDAVLNEVYQYWDPPEETVVRLPTSVWKRIHFDIREFLTERQAGGKTVLGWYHRQFIEAASDRYLREPSEAKSRHSLLCDMYLDVYREGEVCPIELVMRGRSFPEADRQVVPQPLQFEKEGMYNLRKLQELPYHLSRADDSERLKDSVVYNFDWLFSKLDSCSFTEVMEDVELLPREDREAAKLRESLLMSRSCIQMEPSALAGQLIARIGDERDSSPRLAELLEQSERWNAITALPLFVPRSVFLKPPGGPLVTTFAGHASRVLKVAVSEAHQVMISACEDDEGHPVAFLWDLKTYELIQDVHVPNRREDLGLGSILLEVDRSEDHFIFGSQELQLFRISNGNRVHTFQCDSEGDSPPFTQVQFVDEDRVVGHRRESGDVFIWDTRDGSLVGRLELCSPVTHFCPCPPGSSVLITASRDGMLRWYSPQHSLSCNHSVRVFDNRASFTAVTLSLDGNFILVSGDDSSLQVWVSSDSDEPTGPIYSLPAHSKPVSCMCSFGQEMVAVGYLDGMLKFWNMSTRAFVQETRPHKKEITCFASVSGLLVVGSLDDTLTVWNRVDCNLMNTLEGHSSWISDVAATLDQAGSVRIASASNDRSVILWNPDLQLINNREKHTKQPFCINISEDGSSLFSGSSDGTIKYWDFSSSKCLHTWEPGVTTTCLLLIDSDQSLVSGMTDGRVALWDVQTLAESVVEERHDKEVTFLRGCVEESRFLSGSRDGTVKIWERGHCVMTYEGHTDTVMDAAATSDGRGIVISGATNGEVRFWDSAGQCLSSAVHCPGLECVVVSHGNQYAATGSKGQTLVVWSLAAGSMGSRLAAVSLSADSVKGVAFTYDDRFIISGSHMAKKQLHKWDFLNDKDNMYFEGHTHAVMCLYLTSNDRYLITGSRDCTLKAWDMTSGQVLASFHCASQVKHFAVAEVTDGHYRVLAANKSGEMALYDLYLDDEVTRLPHLRDQSSPNGFQLESQFQKRSRKMCSSRKTKICELI